MNSNSNLPHAWERLASARRQAIAALPPADDEAAPFGFAQRMAARAMVQHPAGPGWWTRWTMRAALLCGAVAGFLFFVAPPDNDNALLFATPPIDVPSLGSP